MQHLNSVHGSEESSEPLRKRRRIRSYKDDFKAILRGEPLEEIIMQTGSPHDVQTTEQEQTTNTLESNAVDAFFVGADLTPEEVIDLLEIRKEEVNDDVENVASQKEQTAVLIETLSTQLTIAEAALKQAEEELKLPAAQRKNLIRIDGMYAGRGTSPIIQNIRQHIANALKPIDQTYNVKLIARDEALAKRDLLEGQIETVQGFLETLDHTLHDLEDKQEDLIALLATAEVEAQKEPEVLPTESVADFAFMGNQSMSDFSTFDHPILGKLRVQSGGGTNVSTVNGALRGNTNGSDHMNIWFTEGVQFIESVQIKSLTRDATRNFVVRGQKNGVTVFEQVVSTMGSMTVTVNQEIDLLQFSLINGPGEIVDITVPYDPSHRHAQPLASTGPQMDVGMALGSMSAEQAVKELTDKLPANLPAAVKQANDFTGDMNDAMNANVASQFLTALQGRSSKLTVPTNNDVVTKFYAAFPDWRPENKEAVMQRNRWNSYTYHTSLNGEMAKYGTHALHQYGEDMKKLAVHAVDYVFAASYGNVARMKEIRSQMEGYKTNLKDVGISFPAPSVWIEEAYDLVNEDYDLLAVAMGQLSAEEAQIRQEQWENGSYAGTGAGFGSSSSGIQTSNRNYDRAQRLANNIIETNSSDPRVQRIIAGRENGGGSTTVIAGNTISNTPTSTNPPTNNENTIASENNPSVTSNVNELGISNEIVALLQNANVPAEVQEQIEGASYSALMIKNASNTYAFEMMQLQIGEPVYVAGPVPMSVNKASDPIALETMKETSAYQEAYGQVRDLLTLIHNGFDQVIASYQQRIDMNSQKFLTDENLSSYERFILAGDAVSAATLKAALKGMQAGIARTPEGLAFDTLLLLSGAGLTKVFKALGEVVKRMDDIAGTGIGRTLAPIITNTSQKVDSLRTEVHDLILEAERILIHNDMKYTFHAWGRMAKRNFTPENVENALKFGEKIADKVPGRTRHILQMGNDKIRVITNEFDVIISVVRELGK